MSNNRFIIPVFVPHRGCPNDCVFCNQRKITGQKNVYDYSQIDEEIMEAVKTIDFSKDPDVEIAFYGGTFTAIDVESQETFLKIASKYVDNYKIKGIRLSTRPDAIDEVVLKRLKKYGVKTIELGVQSLNEDVLLKSNRGHDSKIVYESAKLIKDYGFILGIQLMIGLPGDNLEINMRTVNEVIKMKPDIARIYPTLVIKDTELARMYEKGLYKPLNVMEAVEISKEMYKVLFSNNINVIRIGLQPTENILEGKDVVAGPFHSAFRELVISSYIFDLIKETIENESFNEIEFEINNKDVSYLVGNKGINKKLIKDELNVKKMKIKINNDIDRGIFFINSSSFNKKIKFSI
ncbi:radical SAM protein [Clostridiaceae bacterium HSG29]|nr:radical SAM protein [Clostridiaceae bacterium HSG29]